MRLLHVTDIHGNRDAVDRLAAAVTGIDLLVLTGDLGGTGRGEASGAEIIDALERLAVPCVAVHGNWDGPGTVAALEGRGWSVHGTGRVLGEAGFFGSGGSGRTPFRTPAEYPEGVIAGFLDEGYRAASMARVTVLLSHAPPRGILDRTFIGLRAGSRSVRRYIDIPGLILCCCGHIHEAKGISREGGTTIVNGGSLDRGDYAVIDLSRDSTGISVDARLASL